jgi:hypothetical protein
MLEELMAIPSWPVSAQRPMMEKVMVQLLCQAKIRRKTTARHSIPSILDSPPSPRNDLFCCPCTGKNSRPTKSPLQHCQTALQPLLHLAFANLSASPS